MVESGDGALRLFVGGRLGGDPLHPQSGCGHDCEERFPVLGGEADYFVGEAGDDR